MTTVRRFAVKRHVLRATHPTLGTCTPALVRTLLVESLSLFVSILISSISGSISIISTIISIVSLTLCGGLQLRLLEERGSLLRRDVSLGGQ